MFTYSCFYDGLFMFLEIFKNCTVFMLLMIGDSEQYAD